MITTLPQDELLELGSRHRADYLDEQAGYTLGLAALLPPWKRNLRVRAKGNKKYWILKRTK